jgi:plastocyanin
MRRRLSIALALLVAAVLALTAVPAGAAPKQVTIKGSVGLYSFKPGKVTITKGHKVSWSWDSDAEHNVHFGEKLDGKHSKTAAKVSDFTIKFRKTGTFKYRCTVHDFTGKVVVKAP